jgi:hypothetical protein
MSTAVVPFDQQMRLADAFVKSGLFGLKDPAQALALMALCEADGLHPAAAIREYHIIQGKPAMKADAMLARFQRAGGSVNWLTYTDEKVAAIFSHPQGGQVTVEWTPARAKQAGIRNEMWTKYPRNMMRSRCISEGVRATFPGVATGAYTVEEVQDMTPQQVRDMGAVEIVPPPPVDEALAKKLRACKTMGDLTAEWQALSRDQRASLASVKDEVKAKLVQKLEDLPPPVDPFVTDMEAAKGAAE